MTVIQPFNHVSNTTLKDIAETYETPTYVYDVKKITENFNAYKAAFANRKHQICYAVKANSNLSILKHLADLGSGFDIVSIGELQRVLMAGGLPEKTIFSGVGKQMDEIAFALEVGIGAFDIESLAELDMIISVAKEIDLVAPISVRFNPDVDAKSHPYISTGLKDSKFGLTQDQAIIAYQTAKESKHIDVIGINMHIGSQITDLSSFEAALTNQAEFVTVLKNELGINLKHINLGGGIGVKYKDETPIITADWVDKVIQTYTDTDVTLVMEPGRSVIANAGVLLTQVLYNKSQSGTHFTIVDAAMNDYTRVALYQAYNEISNLSRENNQPLPMNVVGPVCESGDCFAKARELTTQAGDLLAIHDTGAYGFAMASNYNTRMRPAEVLVDGEDYRLIRRRETFEDLVSAELIGEFELEAEEE